MSCHDENFFFSFFPSNYRRFSYNAHALCRGVLWNFLVCFCIYFMLCLSISFNVYDGYSLKFEAFEIPFKYIT